MKPYAFTRGLDHASTVAASERVAWSVDEIFAGRRFDASLPLVPASWLGTAELDFLDDAEQLVLGHCRAFSYVHLLGNFEEFAPPHLGGAAGEDWHGDRARLRALLRFADEEIKHQQLFRRAELVLEDACGHPFGRYFDDDKTRVTALTAAVLEHSALSRALMVVALEWGTQRHYVESIRDDAGVDPLYAAMLKAHWLEEAQHVKTDALEITRMASGASPESLVEAFEEIEALGALVEVAFAAQAVEEVETLRRVTGREYTAHELTALHAVLHRSLRDIVAGVGLGHPSFARLARELSPEGAAKLGIA
jgi:hypothetical protein